MALATATDLRRHSTALISSDVASDLITKVAGKRTGRRSGAREIPVVGGVVGAGRRRVRDLADRPLRRPRAPAPRPSVDRRAAPRPAARAGDGARRAGAQRTTAAGRPGSSSSRVACELAVEPGLLAAQPGVLEQQRLDRVDGRAGDRPLGRRVRVGVRRRRARPRRRSDTRRPRRSRAARSRRPRRARGRGPRGTRSAGARSRGDVDRFDSVWWASSSRTSGR